MNLENMLSSQKVLDDRIIKEKGLEGQDLFPNTILALQVELAEFANEGRWFKHWSDDREPRTEYICEICEGSEEISVETAVGNPEHGFDVFNFDANCPMCIDVDEDKNPLLEEFSDGVHFFLSIANQKGWQDALFILEEQLYNGEFNGDLTAWYLEMIYFLNLAYMCVYPEDDRIAGFQKNAYYFRLAWIFFLNLGINGFGLTFKQIEDAYFAKNIINHQRQESGY